MRPALAGLTVLLDMDGPLAGFDEQFHQRALEEGWTLDIEHPRDQVHRYLTDHLPDPRHRAAARRVLETDTTWFATLPVVEYAQEGVAELEQAGASLWVCTKPLEKNAGCRDGKGAWLRRHFGTWLENRLIVAPDKSMVRGDLLLDDAPKRSWLARAEWAPVVFTCPFNGEGSEWADLQHWAWGDPVEELAEAVQARRRLQPVP